MELAVLSGLNPDALWRVSSTLTIVTMIYDIKTKNGYESAVADKDAIWWMKECMMYISTFDHIDTEGYEPFVKTDNHDECKFSGLCSWWKPRNIQKGD